MARYGRRASGPSTSSGSTWRPINGSASTRPITCQMGSRMLAFTRLSRIHRTTFGWLNSLKAISARSMQTRPRLTWYPIPTAHARARRMQIDDQDRVLVTEYRASKVALFDTKTEKFTEYKLPDYTF